MRKKPPSPFAKHPQFPAPDSVPERRSAPLTGDTSGAPQDGDSLFCAAQHDLSRVLVEGPVPAPTPPLLTLPPTDGVLGSLLTVPALRTFLTVFVPVLALLLTAYPRLRGEVVAVVDERLRTYVTLEELHRERLDRERRLSDIERKLDVITERLADLSERLGWQRRSSMGYGRGGQADPGGASLRARPPPLTW